MRGLRGLLVNTLLVTGALGVSLAAALLADSWLGLGLRPALALALETSVQEAEPIMYVYDNRTGWLLNPRTQYHRARSGPLHGIAGLDHYDNRLRVNSDGFLDRDHALTTPYYRIAFLGNSWVEAVQRPYHERFAPLTEDLVFSLSQHRRAIEVMNFGLSNAAPAQDYGILKHFAMKYRPDEVWLFVNPWDLRSNSSQESGPPFGPTYEYTDSNRTEIKDIRFGFVDPPAYGQWKREREFAGLRKDAPTFAQVIPYFYSAEHSPAFEHAWTEMRLTIALIRKTLEASRIRMRLVYLPLPQDIDAKRWDEFRRQSAKDLGRELAQDQGLGEARYAHLAKELGIEFVSLLPACKARGAKEVFGDHLSAMGHYVVADHLARIIIDSTPERPLPGG
jgi:hypothetical protein